MDEQNVRHVTFLPPSVLVSALWRLSYPASWFFLNRQLRVRITARSRNLIHKCLFPRKSGSPAVHCRRFSTTENNSIAATNNFCAPHYSRRTNFHRTQEREQYIVGDSIAKLRTDSSLDKLRVVELQFDENEREIYSPRSRLFKLDILAAEATPIKTPR